MFHNRTGLTLLCIAAFAAAAGSPGRAQETRQPQRPAEQGPAPERDAETERPRLICRTLEGSGSRLRSQRVCLTREGWRRARNLT